jgi:hypothetical protein
MKPETREKLINFFGEIVFQLILVAIGGVGIGYLFIGTGMLLLLLPLGILIFGL